MAWHVIWSFVSVREMWIVFGNEAFHVGFQIETRGMVGIFHQYETATCMAAEDGQRSVLQFGNAKSVMRFVRNFVSALSACVNLDLRLKDCHAAGYCCFGSSRVSEDRIWSSWGSRRIANSSSLSSRLTLNKMKSPGVLMKIWFRTSLRLLAEASSKLRRISLGRSPLRSAGLPGTMLFIRTRLLWL